jgi:hypothetical protein
MLIYRLKILISKKKIVGTILALNVYNLNLYILRNNYSFY